MSTMAPHRINSGRNAVRSRPKASCSSLYAMLVIRSPSACVLSPFAPRKGPRPPPNALSRSERRQYSSSVTHKLSERIHPIGHVRLAPTEEERRQNAEHDGKHGERDDA